MLHVVKSLVERLRHTTYVKVGMFNYNFIKLTRCWYLSPSLSEGLGEYREECGARP